VSDSSETPEEVRQKLVAALEAVRVEFAPGAAEAIGRIDWDEPDFTLTDLQPVSAWGPWTRKDGSPGNDGGLEVRWATASAGCGRIALYLKDGKLHCDSEGMDRDFVKEALAQLVERAEFDS
jgi:hypothetical protein